MPRDPYIADIRRRIGHDLLILPTVAVVIWGADNRLLLVQHSETNEWTLPSGIVEPLESPSDAALRETWEETGIEIELKGLLGIFGGPNYVHTYRNRDRVNFVTSLFVAHPRTPGNNATAEPQDEEISQCGWFDENSALELELKHDARDYLVFACAAAQPAYFPPPTWRPPPGEHI